MLRSNYFVLWIICEKTTLRFISGRNDQTKSIQQKSVQNPI